MCLYPKLIKNKKYVSNNKNKGNIPIPQDKRVLLVPVGCGKCMECRKQKARNWSIRLQEHIREMKHNEKHFVTLTFSDQSIKELHKDIKGLEGYELDNEIATLATRRFLERWRKEYKKSIQHWLITEIGSGDKKAGHKGTENIHIHGILFTKNKENIERIWKYGFVYIGDYVTERTINYCAKYVTKIDPKHTEYNPKILTSPGIGKNYINRYDAETNKYKQEATNETYQTREGKKINLPNYWRNKIYTEDEREKLWLEKLNKQERWVNGVNISTANGQEHYYAVLKEAQAKNKQLGYGDDSKNWNRIRYENERRKLKTQERINKANNDKKTNNRHSGKNSGQQE